MNVATVHDYRDVLFGNHAPEPDDHLLESLREKMREQKAHIGIATDGTVYLGYQAIDGHAHIAVSHDRGIHWSPSFAFRWKGP